ncbi:MAG: hypothetical protein Tp138OMZ00d2C19078241_3 [Prokaryotic dsDNA virus sp.]|jgi:hypothetical protein|nr:MAG: hypothetical protein Tp138OMZ00d2C19078241_3 [Prokaryotic dsDNA virus sp.]|tara:strand:- start:23666 stop:24505 length:840 start_codon:yes stop_codon:yes gene_type:complete
MAELTYPDIVASPTNGTTGSELAAAMNEIKTVVNENAGGGSKLESFLADKNALSAVDFNHSVTESLIGNGVIALQDTTTSPRAKPFYMQDGLAFFRAATSGNRVCPIQYPGSVFNLPLVSDDFASSIDSGQNTISKTLAVTVDVRSDLSAASAFNTQIYKGIGNTGTNFIQISNAAIRCQCAYNLNVFFDTAYTIPDGIHTIIYTADNDFIRLYVDGVEVGFLAAPALTNVNADIGTRTEQYAIYDGGDPLICTGRSAELAATLSAAEVAELHSAMVTP